MKFMRLLYLLVIYATQCYGNDICSMELAILALGLVIRPETPGLIYGVGWRRVTPAPRTGSDRKTGSIKSKVWPNLRVDGSIDSSE